MFSASHFISVLSVGFGVDFTGYSWMLILLLLLQSSMKSGYIQGMKPLEQPQALQPKG
jgi:hypothetical protein